MSVYEHSIDDIWNSDHMRDVRRKMLSGQPVAECGYCDKQHQAGITSMGAVESLRWRTVMQSEGLSPEEFCQDVRGADFVVDGAGRLDLDMGNLCNLKCRMCNSSYSSAIANDPIHSKWAPPGPVAARWQGVRAQIAPRHVLGVAYEGFGWLRQNDDDDARCAAKGEARLRAVIQGMDVAGVWVRLAAASSEGEATTVRILVNEHLVYDALLPAEGLNLSFAVPALRSAANLEMSIFTSEMVFVDEIALERPERGKSAVAFSRLSDGSQWFQNREFLVQELLSRPEHLRNLRLIGGEPLLIKEVKSLLLHLIEIGAAPQIELNISTNATQSGRQWSAIFSKFKRANILFSLDGFGAVNDYIRYPSKWTEIDENIREFVEGGGDFYANMTVQAYNALNVVELVKYCQELGIVFRYHLLQYPDYLGVGVMAPRARAMAVARLRNSAPDFPAYATDLLALADLIEATPPASPEQQQRFIQFSLGIDVSRGQQLRASLPELARLSRPASSAVPAAAGAI